MGSCIVAYTFLNGIIEVGYRYIQCAFETLSFHHLSIKQIQLLNLEADSKR